MNYPHQNFPTIESQHLMDARLFANRNDLVAAFAKHRTEVIAEVGVAMGDFSEFLIKTLHPKSFYAFDLFNMHETEAHWGVPSKKLFMNLSHSVYYQWRLESLPCELTTVGGLSEQTLGAFDSHFFDLVYVDGDHSLEGCSIDLKNAGRCVKPDGIIICNDYIMYDHNWLHPYGVVPAVNEFVASTDWKIVGLALQHHMFCDVALARVAPAW